ncbi:carbamoyltransferase HypF [Desulforegula conservatrix]|uniref:carbamoyltransferase HypF n=1 Tax=Desulforegula conservatrix TaxID=153026 RepID=UPI000426D126|nr:carbamoyltransferase HypF [Desulforegula conservatrix]
MSFDAIPSQYESETVSEKIIVKGMVQGVGFRPFVHNNAKRLGLTGKVKNTREGVEIIIQGGKSAITLFKKCLSDAPPKLSGITEILVEPFHLQDFDGFTIETSTENQTRGTMVPPDASVCDSCLSEMGNPENRRSAYPFITCTDCGPRFSIIKDIPFDRINTTMDSFPMCKECSSEYGNPGDRRFHAQTICCHVCGPKVFLYHGKEPELSDRHAIEAAVSMLQNGKIVALKGIGGFHLAADATNQETVSRLRHLKARGDKPFAVMAASLDAVRSFAEVGEGEAGVLMSSARPVVILKKKKTPEKEWKIAEDVAPGNPMIGVMLPYAPLHALLFKKNQTILVMTSANRKGEPIICKNQDAIASLSGMADGILLHDRDIHMRSDDSVGRWIDDRFRLIRRSRGYAPMPVSMINDTPQILATGGIMKNTLCMVKCGSAFLSQHIGDLETPSGLEFFHETACHMRRLIDANPSLMVNDSHPDYITSGLGKSFPHAEAITVQHHHAHIVSCMVENGYNGDVIGLAFDGTGYGDDGTIWGGEVLIASRKQYIRAAHLETVPMPGGSAAVKEPWRMGISWLYNTFGDDMWNLDVPIFKKTGISEAKTLVHMMKRKINSPLTSSMGRLFDAVSAIIGLCQMNTFDGQAAMALEMCALNAPWDIPGYSMDEVLPDKIHEADGIIIPDMKPLIRAIVSDLESHVDKEIISARFHNTVINIFAEISSRLAEQTGMSVAALSGGVFQNAWLLSGLSKALSEKNLTVLTHSIVPTNDGGLSLGQAGIAAATCQNHLVKKVKP